MLGRVVITSVPRGLDGGAGFQTVLRTHGMQPSVAERLAARAAYPHPFPFGDPRNPHVLFHRIERVGDRTIHMLGSIRDAGGSYTGRSNHLAELIAIDSAETRSLPGGPGFAALAFPWLGRWTGEPRAVPLAEEIAIPAHDPSDPEATRLPARCTAWEKATGDAGWAGELAQSFLDGRRALIWAGDTVNVLELFTEALRLLPASVRWQVTFNTCEIEPFPAHWRAVRPELGLVGNYEPTNELRLVLGKIRESRSRAPDHDLSRQARGEAPARENTSAPSRDRGNVSATSEDDAALRARLREISETRRSRTGPAVVARTAPRTPGMQRWIQVVLLGAIALGVLAILSIGIAPVAVRSSRLGRSDDLLPDRDLRSTSEENERAARLAEETKRAAERAKDVARERAKTEQADAERATAERAEAERAKTQQAENQRVENERAKKERAETRKAQRTAIQKLTAEDITTVSLIDSKRKPDLSPDQTSTRHAVELCDDFDIDNLISPLLELASPYNEADRLRVDDRSDSLSEVPTWPISGTIFRESEGTRTKAIEAGRIVAREGKLFLEIEPLGPRNSLFERLQNSLLVIRTGDPGATGNLAERRKIRLASPVKLPKPYLLDPLSEQRRFSVRIEESLNERMKGIEPPKYLQWRIELTHPSLQKPVTLSHDSTEKRFSLANPTLRAASHYHAIDKNGNFQNRDAEVRFDVVVRFVKSKEDGEGLFKFLVEVATAESSILANPLITKRIEQFRDRQNSDSRDELRMTLDEGLHMQPDPLSTQLAQRVIELELAYRNIPPPSDPARFSLQWQNNDEGRAAYHAHIADVKKSLDEARVKVENREALRGSTFSDDAENLCTALVDGISLFKPIEARIKEVTATAVSGSGTEYRIPIVVPSADPVQD